MKRRDAGPVEILCKEIGFRFHRQMESREVLLAFVGVLVCEIADMRALAVSISGIPGVTSKPPSEASATAIEMAMAMLTSSDPVESAASLHNFCHETNPDDAYPTDRLIDLISICASAVRFGLETPCRSRHAAEATSWVWKAKYGISCEDRHTSGWCKDWACFVMEQALASFIPTTSDGGV